VVIRDAQESSNLGSVSLKPKGSVHKRHKETATSSVFCKKTHGDSGGEVNILGGDGIDNIEKKMFISTCIYLWMITEVECFFFNLTCTISLVFPGAWMKNEVYKRKLNTWDEFLARILDAAAPIEKREDQLRGITRDLRTGVAKSNDAEGGIFEHLLQTATKLLFKH
jgi:hypothetical protein